LKVVGNSPIKSDKAGVGAFGFKPDELHKQITAGLKFVNDAELNSGIGSEGHQLAQANLRTQVRIMYHSYPSQLTMYADNPYVTQVVREYRDELARQLPTPPTGGKETPTDDPAKTTPVADTYDLDAGRGSAKTPAVTTKDVRQLEATGAGSQQGALAARLTDDKKNLEQLNRRLKSASGYERDKLLKLKAVLEARINQ
jgi:hypothetical protein